MDISNWMTQVRKGLLEVAVLNALREKERYGYDLVRRLVDLPEMGLTEGTIYPLLSRLRLQGLVETRLEESPAGPARKYYALSAKGRATLSEMNKKLELLVDNLQNFR